MSTTSILAIVSIVLFGLLVGAAIVIYIQTIQKANLRQKNNQLQSGLGFILLLCGKDGSDNGVIQMISDVADRSSRGNWITSVAPVVLESGKYWDK